MAYTPGLGRTPAVAATRIISACVAAGAVVAAGLWWPAGSVPGVAVLVTLAALGFLVCGGGLAVPLVTANRPPRVVALDGGVAIPQHRLTPSFAVIAMFVLFAVAAMFAFAGDVVGPRASSPVVWAAVAAGSAYLATYVLVQRPWRRRVELTGDALVLRTGEEVSRIPWADIASIDQAPLASNARSGPAHMRAYNAAAITVTRRSDAGGPRARRLEDHYPTGDLACPFASLLPALQSLAAHPQAREALSDPDQARRLLSGGHAIAR